VHRCLVVANRTLGGQHLLDAMRERAAREPTQFHVVVPVTHPNDRAWSDGQTRAEAERRLRTALDRFREAGFEVTGEVGDDRPIDAIGTVLRREGFDEIILSTLPAGMSRWLRWDLPSRVERAFTVPVTHVVASPASV
jgi:hypothetical protein